MNSSNANMNQESELPVECRNVTPQPCAGGLFQQRRLLEYLDGGLSKRARHSMAAHLAICENCSSSAAQWTELEAELCTHVRACPLSSDFSRRVWLAIQSLPSSNSTAVPVPRAMDDTEWPAAWAGHRRLFRWPQMLFALDQLGYWFGIVVTLCLLCRFTPKLLNGLVGFTQGPSPEGIFTYALAVSFPIVLVASAFAAKRPLARFLAKL